MDRGCNTVQEAVIKTFPKKKRCNKAKWLCEEALQRAKERRETKRHKRQSTREKKQVMYSIPYLELISPGDLGHSHELAAEGRPGSQGQLRSLMENSPQPHWNCSPLLLIACNTKHICHFSLYLNK